MNRKYSNIDDLFRDKFKDFEFNPPDHIWENVRQKITGGGNNNPGKPFTKGGIAGISVIIILIGLFSLYQFRNDANHYQTKGLADSQVMAYNSNSPELVALESSESNMISLDQSDTKGKSKKQEVSKNQVSRFIISTEKEVATGNSLVVPQENLEKSDVEFDEKSEVIPVSNRPVIGDTGLTENSGFENSVGPSQINESTSEESVLEKFEGNAKQTPEELMTEPVPEALPGVHDDYGKPGSWLLGLSFTPELVNYPSENRLNTRNYSLDLYTAYRFSGYLIQTGIGAMWSSDNGKYKIDYNQYLGSYEDVYNITFDTTGGEAIPTYHSETIQVYDTLDHVAVSPTKNKYTYLNIPVLFGYSNEGRHFGWFIKAGPSLSLLINQNIANYNQSLNQNKIINVENEVPARIKTNWQLIMSGGISLGLSEKLSISLEPIFRYYIKSNYEQNNINSKNPYSVGLRAGLQVNF
jgi:hypothetical protein